MTYDKQYTSNVEDARLAIEEYHTLGRHVNADEVWRDAQLIKGSPYDHDFPMALSLINLEDGGEALHCFATFQDGEKTNKLVEKIIGAKLERVIGTKNCYYSPYLKDAFGRELDENVEDASKSWMWKVFVDKVEMAYGAGNPLLDSKAGTILFRDDEFIKSLKPESIIQMNLYRYVGRKGILGSELGIDLPFRDDLIHFKDHEDDSRTATLKVFGKDTNTTYVLPDPVLKDDNEKGLSYIGRNNEKLAELKEYGVVLIEENLNDNLWEQGIINGGVYAEDGKVYKHNYK